MSTNPTEVTKTVSVKVPQVLHEQFDVYCKSNAYNKSGVLRLLMSGLITGTIRLVDTTKKVEPNS